LGLLDTVWALVLPGLISAWNMFIIRNFFQTIPDSLEEAAKIEGAGDFRILLTIVVPLSKAVILTIALFYAVGYWNKWFDVLIYMRSPGKKTLQLVLRDILYSSSGFTDPALADTSRATTVRPPAEVLKMTAIVISTLPIMMVYPFVQRHFIRGVMIGSIKG
jgi:putative aldouronate transport system permease protein